jgi:hypothetical protein
MQRSKDTKSISELKDIASDPNQLVSSLTSVADKFLVKKHAQIFDSLKCKGIAMSSLVSILLILPFYGFANIYQLAKCRLRPMDFEAGKTTFYHTKNNEFIDWRKLLLLHAKRFMYLINNNISLKSDGIKALVVDDTPIEKTGKKIENVSILNDHVTRRFILGYKLLVCGFWDGANFIPLDFSLHREKGTKADDFINAHHKARKTVISLRKANETVERKILATTEKLKAAETKYSAKPNKTNKLSLEKHQSKFNLLQQEKQSLTKQLEKAIAQKQEAYNKLKCYYTNGKMYGLTTKERNEQFKKAVSAKSHGFIRRKECRKSKIDSMLLMLGRILKAGIKADYLLVDSWFFCHELLLWLNNLKNNKLKLISMVKVNNQKFTTCQSNKELPANAIAKCYQSQIQRCKKHKAEYIRVKCWYKGIRVNLFYVRMGRGQNWHLLLTTDLDINFVKLLETYHIRWSIEVFFKESKQYLGLSDCRSNTFDAQIADISLSMMQHIMLSYYKRINCQQSMGQLFEQIRHEIVELDLVSRLIKLLNELLEIICEMSGIDFIEFQQDIMRNEKIAKTFIRLLPDTVLEKAA